MMREIRSLKGEVEDLRGQNRILQTRVETLEDSVESNKETVVHLTKLIQNMGGQMKDLITSEINSAKQQLNKELRNKMTEFEVGFQNKQSGFKNSAHLMEGESPARDFTLMGNTSGGGIVHFSGSKGKNSDSSLRNKQKGLHDMMNQLKETISLRVD